jgi:hypothetical protein
MTLILVIGFREAGQMLGNQDLTILILVILSLGSYEFFGLQREYEQPRSTASQGTECYRVNMEHSGCS